ncbi:MAG: dihydroneopterin aldolase [Qingshengfaniella sp.]
MRSPDPQRPLDAPRDKRAALPMPDETRPRLAGQDEGRDVIFVSGLRVPAFIGVLEQEYLERQDVIFDIEMTTVPAYADLVRETGRFVSYSDVVDYIEAKAASTDHVGLVEEWAEDVASFVLCHDLVEYVKVRVSKPSIFAAAAGVGICIERRRAA